MAEMLMGWMENERVAYALYAKNPSSAKYAEIVRISTTTTLACLICVCSFIEKKRGELSLAPKMQIGEQIFTREAAWLIIK